MNTISRGIKNTLRSPAKSVAIALMLAISISLVLAMLAARTSIETKINEIKSSSATTITISPAGIQGFAGGGNLLDNDDLNTIQSIDNVEGIVASLSDQISSDETNLESAIEMGDFGARQQRFESSSSSESDGTTENSDSLAQFDMRSMGSRLTVTGTTDANSIFTNVDLTIEGQTIDGDSGELVALIGDQLAEKNGLSVGDTFTAYDQVISIYGIYTTDNTYQDNSIIIPLKTLQDLTDQTGLISSITLNANNSDNVESVVDNIKTALGDEVDVTSEAETAASNAEMLSSISSLTMAGIIASSGAATTIILLATIMIVRERRREIGVLKAIGGSNFKIITQFITEALTLTVIGTIIGFALGILISTPLTNALVDNQTEDQSQVQNNQSVDSPGDISRGMSQSINRSFNRINQTALDVTSNITPQIIVLASGIIAIIVIIGSAVPAWFITRIRPAEVLRME